MSNPFLDYGDEVSNGLKRKLRTAATRREKAIARKQLEDAVLLELWQKDHKSMWAALEAGCYAKDAKTLAAVLAHLPEDGDDLIALVMKGPWRDADATTKFTVLHLINQAIMHRREMLGQPPFDDDLDDPPQTVFLQIRGLLT